ncbi:MAG: bifunctional 2-C-methyl-D-erythritol 4-phosphate cytidylyltransferase/2-C-methyl-D-erythritol 2,4-cyclodiphosphate synthase [Sphingomonadales bacterium]|nr:bifunctional 2-C-methyl-D-erythritol 4-phosphate cytidylyltransferase/2-C-methyl-D-erythritol 2,4-cyclodiphosphate synthase [Sphingomonadales bacterium]
MSVAAIIVAAGRGVRAGGEMPKQYRALAGKPVLRHTAEAFAGHPSVDRVLVVYNPADQELYNAAVGDLELLPPVAGGASRQESVRNGLQALAAPETPEVVLIHDAARAFVPPEVIQTVIDAVADGGAIPALPVVDTLKRAEDGATITETVSRSGLWRAQTPQGFPFAAILAAHEAAAGEELTDDAAVAERAGIAVTVVPGAEENIKLTTQQDFDRAERALAGTETRTGMGYDVHRFGPGDHVMLCGIAVPHSHGLIGHSDADAGLHALTDALLGAIGAGDIGDHFPPSDPKWAGAPSDVFLKHAAELVAARGGRIVNLDLTLICERPKIGPHRETMRARVSEIVGTSEDRVSIKATTTERLGFTGREEGIAAQAIATIVM